MKTNKSYKVVVIETNEIAGERVACEAVAFVARTLAGAREWAFSRWAGQPPAGAKIVHTDGDVYDVPEGRPLIDILE